MSGQLQRLIITFKAEEGVEICTLYRSQDWSQWRAA
jgi:hypothetical protein